MNTPDETPVVVSPVNPVNPAHPVFASSSMDSDRMDSDRMDSDRMDSDRMDSDRTDSDRTDSDRTDSDGAEPARVWVGIDVSQDHLDVCVEQEPPVISPLLPSGKPSGKPSGEPSGKRQKYKKKHNSKSKVQHRQFPNSPEGWSKLRGWINQLCHAGRPGALVPHYCLEATGSYSLPLSLFLSEKGCRVSVVNPRLIANHAKKRDQGNKTDKADAATIADYCRKERPPLWEPPSAALLQLQALVRRFEAVQDLAQQEKCRLAAPGQPQAVLDSVRATLSFLEQEMERLRQQIQTHVQNDDGQGGLKHQVKLLTSIGGIGEATAHLVLAELGDVTRFDDAGAVGAFAGLAPREYKSGSSIHKASHMSRRGSWRLRKGLYFPTIVACRFNSVIRAFYQRLLARGMAKKAAIVASMRKLLMICYGVLKSQTPFREDWVQ